MGEKIVPQVILDLPGRADKPSAHQVAEAAVGDRQAKRDGPVDGQLAPGDALGDAVNHVLQDPRRRHRDRGGSKRAEQSEDVGALTPPDVGQEARERPQHGGSITMGFLTKIATRHRLGRMATIAVAAVACVARPALAQDRPSTNAAIGEKYHVEGGVSLWNPSVFGVDLERRVRDHRQRHRLQDRPEVRADQVP